MTKYIPEPPRSDDDTNPSRVLKAVSPVRPNPAINLLNLLFLVSAAGLTVLAAVLYIQQGQHPAPTPVPTSVVIVPNGAPTDAPVLVTATARPLPTDAPQLTTNNVDVPPAPDVLGALMLESPNTSPIDNVIYRQQTAFTIAPARPRSGPVEYRIQVGDTIEKIAQRYNITQDSIIWNNDVGYVNRLAVGTTLRIPPVNGILYTTQEGETIKQMADKFKVSPYAIIDSEYNKLQAATPDTYIPPRELEVMIPGGVTKTIAIYWKPTIQTRPSGSGRSAGQVSFGGGAGSCGFVSNGGGDGSLGRPLDGYTVIRGYSAVHSGIDLAKSSGSPVLAAGSGTVIFAGWSEWGYGNAIVIAHTPDLWTLYGHLSRINVSCGQFVNRAAVIGAVGSTGNSTGPHLHFETRIGGDPVNPVSILGGF